jgi:hypothetical protein
MDGSSAGYFWLPEPAYAVYQSETDQTIVTFTYSNNAGVHPHICVINEGHRIFFVVQAVTGYFIHDGLNYDSDQVYEGVASDRTTFEVIIPVTAVSGVPKPTSTIFVPSLPSSSYTTDPSTPNSPLQGPWITSIFVVVATVCVIVVPVVFVLYFSGRQRKTCSLSNSVVFTCEVKVHD